MQIIVFIIYIKTALMKMLIFKSEKHFIFHLKIRLCLLETIKLRIQKVYSNKKLDKRKLLFHSLKFIKFAINVIIIKAYFYILKPYVYF